jgi:plasmid stabilization system protein ParE
MANNLFVHPAFYRRVRHYRDRIAIHDGHPQTARKFVLASQDIILQLLKNPRRGHSARFESSNLTDVLRVALPHFPIFAVFYRWDGKFLTVITLEHTAQDLPARVAALLSAPT